MALLYVLYLTKELCTLFLSEIKFFVVLFFKAMLMSTLAIPNKSLKRYVILIVVLKLLIQTWITIPKIKTNKKT